MSNDGNSWHSDDELASALERALEIPADGRGETGEAYGAVEPAASTASTASHDFSDLFAALTESEEPPAVREMVSPPPAIAETVSDAAPVLEVTEPAGEQVFESLDDFKPRTNFITVVTPETQVPSIDAIDEVVLETPLVPERTVSASVPVTSAHVTQPIRWDRKRPTFDEIISGTATNAESN
jgi:hypothetical protein